MSTTKKEKDIANIGEFGLINLLTANKNIVNQSSLVGVGDDAAVLDFTGYRTVVTTDILTEGIHFDLTYTPLKHLGYKAVIVNLSDVYAMNATPTQVLISIAASAKITTEMLEEIYEGIYLACDKYKVDVVGGDTSSSLTGLIINITALGIASESDLVYRKGAIDTDLICVTGDLGAAFIGLQLLEREKRIFHETGNVQPNLTGYEYVLERQLKPEAQMALGVELKKLGLKPTSMIDISDGLSSELLHLCKASGLGCRLFADKIPIVEETILAAEEMNIEPITVALNGGEDYELLFTLPLTDYDRITKLPGVSIIGHMSKATEGQYLVNPDGSMLTLRAMGWNSMLEE